MIKKVDLNEILDNENIVFIDVRSPKEYYEDTIPGAINMPILTDEEREHVGYIYKQVDIEQAKELGLKYASQKLSRYYKKVNEIKESGKDIALFCYRGGMRSFSLASVFNVMGIDVYLVQAGYKSYRKCVIENLKTFENKFKFIVLHGYTGVGKTKILKLLKEKNEPVLDLEYLASNSGSVFGNIVFQGRSNTQKRFESLLLEQLKSIKENYIFVENESKRIGNVFVPDFLFKNITEGYNILINTSLENRIQNILDDYVNINIENKDEKIIDAIIKLRKKLGNKKVNELVDKIKVVDYAYVIEELMLKYYDPLYQYSIDKIKQYDKIIVYENIIDAANELVICADENYENSLIKLEDDKY